MLACTAWLYAKKFADHGEKMLEVYGSDGPRRYILRCWLSTYFLPLSQPRSKMLIEHRTLPRAPTSARRFSYPLLHSLATAGAAAAATLASPPLLLSP